MGLMSEYIKRNMSANDLEAELLGLIARYNKKRGTFALVFVAALGKPVPDVALCQDDYYTIHDLLKDVGSQNVDIYLETPGGSGEAAEEIVRCLHAKFDRVAFAVSGEAKSAGTIMVLSGDEILMSETGSLGPIDAQVKIGRSVISAFDYVEWTDSKRIDAEKNGRLNPFDATMVAQISPGELSGVLNSLKFAEDLVTDWLAKYKFKNWTVTEGRKVTVTPEMRLQRAKTIANELTNHGKWRSHGRSIKAKALNDIGLKVTRIEDDPELSEIVYRIQTVCRMLFSTTHVYKIFATEREKVYRSAVPNPPVTGIPGGVVGVPEVVEIGAQCTKCGKVHRLYGKFVKNEQIDKDFKEKGCIPFPKNGKLQCNCGADIDLAGIRKEVEMKAGKPLVV